MPLFECANCGARDNTALTNYAMRVYGRQLPPLCSECDPDIGQWHGRFEKRPWNQDLDGPHETHDGKQRRADADRS